MCSTHGNTSLVSCSAVPCLDLKANRIWNSRPRGAASSGILWRALQCQWINSPQFNSAHVVLSYKVSKTSRWSNSLLLIIKPLPRHSCLLGLLWIYPSWLPSAHICCVYFNIKIWPLDSSSHLAPVNVFILAGPPKLCSLHFGVANIWNIHTIKRISIDYLKSTLNWTSRNY